jgi:hypothetical protein
MDQNPNLNCFVAHAIFLQRNKILVGPVLSELCNTRIKFLITQDGIQRYEQYELEKHQ